MQKLDIKSVNTLDVARPQYRLGDAVVQRYTRGGKQALERVALHPQYFADTVLYKYALKIDKHDPTPQWRILKQVVFEHTKTFDLPSPQKSELVIHLRMGDTKGYKDTPGRFADYIFRLLERSERLPTQITVVTAIHFGELLLRYKMTTTDLGLATRAEVEKIERIVELLAKSGLPVKLCSHEAVDKDFCYLASSKYLVLGNGLFSLCAAMISEARCFIPAWTRTGSAVGDQLLQCVIRQRKM